MLKMMTVMVVFAYEKIKERNQHDNWYKFKENMQVGKSSVSVSLSFLMIIIFILHIWTDFSVTIELW